MMIDDLYLLLIMASLHEWLREGKDASLLELSGWVLIILGLTLVSLDLFNLRIPYGRYGSEQGGLFAMLGLTSFKLPAKLAWFVMEMPSFLIPLFLVLNVGGEYVGQFNPNIVLLGMFILHYFNRCV
jgi:3-oxo-5-alpha-steroid 4-dehydrogenase 1